ncbi:MAG: helix-turn-helix domain-containing protein [Prolixibacteraceae bacterium]|jgi:predicted DNA-binding transcriptional regulator YafY|nr:helix-turn-helix domain-containing protein [Prolixibacteraceae bacterium]
MKIFKLLERLDKLLKLINNSNTGTPKELARRLGICKSTLATYIEYFRLMGAKILYNHKFKTYQFNPGSELKLAFGLFIIENGKVKKIFGNINHPCDC